MNNITYYLITAVIIAVVVFTLHDILTTFVQNFTVALAR